jgi:hypothetical protein
MVTRHDNRDLWVGYVLKDWGEPHFDYVHGNMDKQYLDECRRAYMARISNKKDNLRMLTPSNLLKEALQFYNEHLKPVQPPDLVLMVKYLLHSGKFALSGCWSTKKEMNEDRTNGLWKAMFNPKGVEETDLESIMFNKHSFVSRSTVSESFDEIMERAKEARENEVMAFDDEMQEEDEVSAVVPAAQVTPTPFLSFYQDNGPVTRRDRSSPGLSGQTTKILAKRSRQMPLFLVAKKTTL